MTIKQWLKNATVRLQKSDIPTARLDAEILLADILKRDRSWIHAHPETLLQRSDLRRLNEWVERRATHEPIAYIRGKQEFYGRDFYVSPATLTPRPETETLVELALDIIKQENIISVADIGTGSGCIVITLCLETSDDTISFTGYEISKEALNIAQRNKEKYKCDVVLVKNDITSKGTQLWSESDLVVANLPYVPKSFSINLAATHEPDFAIYGGDDGLDYYRHLFKKLNSARFVITESLPPQHNELSRFALQNGYKEIKEQDLIQVFKKIA